MTNRKYSHKGQWNKTESRNKINVICSRVPRTHSKEKIMPSINGVAKIA
jgi:hypothetical protein